MKTLLITTRGLAIVVFSLLSMMAYAQTSSITIHNGSDCSYLVEVRAKDPANCGNACTTGQVCVPPNSTISIPPCGSGNLEWAGAGITPTDAYCNPCPNSGITIARFCYNFPITDSGMHCDSKCRYFKAGFASPTDIKIN